MWRDTLRQRRQALGVSQAQVATRLGITREHLSRLETGQRQPSAALQNQIDQSLANWNTNAELTMTIDYLRVRFPTNNVFKLIKEVLQLNPQYMGHDNYAFYGYTSKYVFSNITVMTSPMQSSLGTLLELKGQGCREFEGVLLAHDRTWFDFFRTCLNHQGIIKRLDLAINDHCDLLDVPQLIYKCQNRECISLMRHFEGIDSGGLNTEGIMRGATLYVGSMKSDIYFCIYKKDAEQQVHPKYARAESTIKNRFEIRLHNVRAQLAVSSLLETQDAETTAFRIIQHYIRFVDRQTDVDHTHWPLNHAWAVFCGQSRTPLRLTLDPEPFDLRRTRAWIKKQVAPTLKILLEIDSFRGNTDTFTMIRKTPLKERHYRILDQQTLGAQELRNFPSDSEPE